MARAVRVRRHNLLWVTALALWVTLHAAWLRLNISTSTGTSTSTEVKRQPVILKSRNGTVGDDQENELKEEIQNELHKSSSANGKVPNSLPKSLKASKWAKKSVYSGLMTCDFAPNATDDCLFSLSEFLCGPQPLQLLKKKTSPTGGNSSQHNFFVAEGGIQQFEELYLSQRRLILLGDSTMGPEHLHKFTMRHLLPQKLNMNPICNKRYSCRHILGKRCSFQHQFGIPLVSPDEWASPDRTKEGPTTYGLENPLCTDCSGCWTGFHHCSPRAQEPSSTHFLHEKTEGTSEADHVDQAKCVVGQGNQTFIYGGFITMEFARDVEWQTKEYKTSQENLAAFLQTSFNHPKLVREFGRPICAVNTGHHDIDIRDITLQQYIKNLQWYIDLLLPQCQFIIWIETTSPKTDDFVQKKNVTRAWNAAVYDMLSSLDVNLSSVEREEYETRNEKNKMKGWDTSNDHRCDIDNCNRIFYMKTFDASVGFQYDDNLHLSSSWYDRMSDTIITALKSCPSGGISSFLDEIDSVTKKKSNKITKMKSP